MVFVQDDYVIKKLSAHTADDALSRSVLPRAPECCALWVDLEALDRTRDGRREDCVVVVDQESVGWLVERLGSR